MARFKVLLFEPIHQKGIDHLENNDAEVVWSPGFAPEDVLTAMEDVDGVIARAQGRFDGPAFDRASRLKVVGRHGIGVDNIDIPAATERGIHVVNTPMAPAEAVAEFVAMGCVAATRNLVNADQAVRQGDWEFRNRHHGPELKGKRLGLIGFGRIGRRVAEICGFGFGMEIVYSDVARVPAEEEARLKATYAPLEEVLETSDFISLHVPLLESTRHLIGAAALERMPSHAYLINCSRGPVVDEAALVSALSARKIAGAVIDVFEKEPAPAGNPLFALDNVILTPHCSGHSNESAENMSMVAADVIRVLHGKAPEYPVNHPPNPRQPVA